MRLVLVVTAGLAMTLTVVGAVGGPSGTSGTVVVTGTMGSMMIPRRLLNGSDADDDAGGRGRAGPRDFYIVDLIRNIECSLHPSEGSGSCAT